MPGFPHLLCRSPETEIVLLQTSVPVLNIPPLSSELCTHSPEMSGQALTVISVVAVSMSLLPLCLLVTKTLEVTSWVSTRVTYHLS